MLFCGVTIIGDMPGGPLPDRVLAYGFIADEEDDDRAWCIWWGCCWYTFDMIIWSSSWWCIGVPILGIEKPGLGRFISIVDKRFLHKEGGRIPCQYY